MAYLHAHHLALCDEAWRGQPADCLPPVVTRRPSTCRAAHAARSAPRAADSRAPGGGGEVDGVGGVELQLEPHSNRVHPPVCERRHEHLRVAVQWRRRGSKGEAQRRERRRERRSESCANEVVEMAVDGLRRARRQWMGRRPSGARPRAERPCCTSTQAEHALEGGRVEEDRHDGRRVGHDARARREEARVHVPQRGQHALAQQDRVEDLRHEEIDAARHVVPSEADGQRSRRLGAHGDAVAGSVRVDDGAGCVGKQRVGLASEDVLRRRRLADQQAE